METLVGVMIAAGLLGALCSSLALWLGVPARFLLWGTIGHISVTLVAAGLGLQMATGCEAAVLLLSSLLFCNTLAWLGWKELRGKSRSPDLSPARGQARRTPAAGAAFAVGALASAGLPGTPGFSGRVLLFFAAAKTGWPLGWLIMVVCAIQSVTWLLACVNAMRVAFLEPTTARGSRQPTVAQRVMWLALAVLSLLLGLFPAPLMAFGLGAASLITRVH